MENADFPVHLQKYISNIASACKLLPFCQKSLFTQALVLFPIFTDLSTFVENYSSSNAGMLA
jgi:hypothetical protein